MVKKRSLGLLLWISLLFISEKQLGVSALTNRIPSWRPKSGPLTRATTQLYQTSVPSSSRSNSPSTTTSSRQKRVSSLEEWAKKSADIQIANGNLAIQASLTSEDAGLGLVSKQRIEAGSVIVTVPASLALSVELPRGGPDDLSVVKTLVDDRTVFRSLPWYTQFAFYLYKLDKISSMKQTGSNLIDMRPWLDSLPRKFTTPIHWTEEQRKKLLQYSHMDESVQRQETSWKEIYKTLRECSNVEATGMSWEDFLWGCETARSRAFSGGYTGAPFNPFIYAFTLVLVTAYIGLNLGTLEQAANGAALVFCGSILRDFVFPKLFRNKKYVICPVIDMCNHNSLATTANVAYEFFANAYSLSTISPVPSNSELFISYGSRSNDQLLQYYGFVERDNPHDIYVMQPLREWDIAALEKACGAPFAPGRLQKLDRAGLLGKSKDDALSAAMPSSKISNDDDSTSEDGTSEGNPRGGVVLSRAGGIDPAVIQALRALVSTDEEWKDAGESIGNFGGEVNPDNERKARLAARTAIEMELASKPTTLAEDREMLKRLISSKSGLQGEDERIGLLFRIEKKKLLKETIDRLQ
ncbi:SET methyltransferase domain containing protein [Nitzschia inconspicua]|uniref:SET methyltransferase domain containing protein n=1 Tax=Nitzschia inconspicua TaxID=303405 RepID=A0A9K3PKK3_9STRA|nr:SET methyltransferase domain containing protein [Nitzschia inconspicua]